MIEEKYGKCIVFVSYVQNLQDFKWMKQRETPPTQHLVIHLLLSFTCMHTFELLVFILT